ncbi:MAG: prefoldin subunit [Nanoarchaeota archaeon]
MTGQIMIRTEKTGVTSELNEKKKLLDLRINAVEKQEKILNQKLEQLKKDVEDKFKNQKAEL